MHNRGSVATALMLAALTVCITANASAQERKLTKADLPAAVQKAVAAQSKGATVRGYSRETDGGQVTYEAEMTVHGHSKDVSFAPDGTVLEIEEQVALASLPAQVRDSLVKKAGKRLITKVESLTKKGALVAYEAQVRIGKRHSEIQVGPHGETLAHEE